jgi:hypothetical protein
MDASQTSVSDLRFLRSGSMSDGVLEAVFGLYGVVDAHSKEAHAIVQ